MPRMRDLSSPAAISRMARFLLMALTAAFTVYPERPALALFVPVVGWGYSVGNGVYGVFLPDQPSVSRGFGWKFDPPAGLVLSGRLTVRFDPSWTIGGVGWFGEFGADPALPPPAIGDGPVDVALLQPNANPLLQSASIEVDQAAGRVIFNFDWGPDGLAVNAEENFAGIYFSNLSALPPDPLTILGSPEDVARNGINSLTFMSCAAARGSEPFFCGASAVPEPSSIALFGAGLAGLATMRAILRRRNKDSRDAVICA
jgi:hypothetical protein